MKSGKRTLAVMEPGSDVGAIRKLAGMHSLIIRHRSYAVEVDFHSNDPEKSLHELSSAGQVISHQDLDESGKVYDDAFFRRIRSEEPVIIEEGRHMFREERYWEAHTVLEDLWKATEGRKKRMLQGIIILAAAMTHHQMGEAGVAHSMYRKAVRMIRGGVPEGSAIPGVPEEFTYPVPFPEVPI